MIAGASFCLGQSVKLAVTWIFNLTELIAVRLVS